MAINDLYHVQFTQRVSGTIEPIQTNWFFNGVGIASTAESLFNGFTDDGGIADLVNAIQPAAMQNVGVKVFNLFSLTDFFEGELTGAGTGGGDMLPVHDGITLIKKLDTRGVRPGRVTIPGIAEVYQSSGVISDADYILAVNNLIEAMVADIEIDADEIYDPVVIKRIKYEVEEDEVPTGRFAYRLPANLGEADFGHVNAVLWNRKVTHVVTRGNGR